MKFLIKYIYITKMADEWVQLGDTVNGIHQSGLGFSVSTNLDGTKMVMGAPYANGDAGMVRVYEDIDGTWTQLGDDITVINEKYLGYSVTMDSTGTIIAISAPHFDSRRGRVRVYEYNDGTSQWTQLSAIYGLTSNERFGQAVSINSSGTRIVIGAPYNDGNGGVRVYAVPGGAAAGAAAGGAAGVVNCDFVMEGLDSAFALSAAINFTDLVHTPATADALPHIDIPVSTADRQDKLNKLFSVELPEGTHIDQSGATLGDQVYESSIAGYAVDSTKMLAIGTTVANAQISGNDDRLDEGVSGADGSALVKLHTRSNAGNDNQLASAFVSDLVYQAFGFRFVEGEISNEGALEDQINAYLVGEGASDLNASLATKVGASQTATSAPAEGDYNLPRETYLSLVHTICSSAAAQSNKRLTNDATSGMFRDANKAGSDAKYFIEFQQGDTITFKLTLSPAAPQLTESVYQNGTPSYQHPKSVNLRLVMQ